MNTKLIKKLTVASAVLANSLILAGMDVDSRISQLESQMKEVRTVTENQTYGAKTATAVPQIKEGKGIFLGLGLVYQTVLLSQSDFCYTADDTTDDPNVTINTPVKGYVKEGAHDYDFGINVQIGYNFEHDNIYGAFTNRYFEASTSSKVGVGEPAGIVPTRISPTITGFDSYLASQASSIWKIGYDLLGFELGKDFFLSKYLSVKPMFGLLLNFIWLEDRMTYSGYVYADDSEYVKDKLNSFGFGPQTGFVLDIGLNKEGFSFFSDTRLALMYSVLKIKHDDTLTGGETPNTLEIKSYKRSVLPYLDTILGISYETITKNEKNHLKLRVGYEVQYLLGINQMIYPVDINSGFEMKLQEGNLETSGLLIDLTWTF